MTLVENVHISFGIVAFTCAILSAKWAMELGFSQFRQVLWGVAGLLLGPLALLILYVRLLYARQAGGEPGGQWISHRACMAPVESGKHIPDTATAHKA